VRASLSPRSSSSPSSTVCSSRDWFFANRWINQSWPIGQNTPMRTRLSVMPANLPSAANLRSGSARISRMAMVLIIDSLSDTGRAPILDRWSSIVNISLHLPTVVDDRHYM